MRPAPGCRWRPPGWRPRTRCPATRWACRPWPGRARRSPPAGTPAPGWPEWTAPAPGQPGPARPGMPERNERDDDGSWKARTLGHGEDDSEPGLRIEEQQAERRLGEGPGRRAQEREVTGDGVAGHQARG